jgi:hypothetical protein
MMSVTILLSRHAYRITPTFRDGYTVEIKRWWWPFWTRICGPVVRADGIRIAGPEKNWFADINKARYFAEQHAIIRPKPRPKDEPIYLGHLPVREDAEKSVQHIDGMIIKRPLGIFERFEPSED